MFQIIDVACPFDTRIAEKEREKIDYYLGLKSGIQKMWNWKNVSVVPIVIGALGAVTKELDVAKELELLQKACNIVDPSYKSLF